MKILLVDDDVSYGTTLAALLTSEETTVAFETSAEQAVERALSEPFDVLIVDYRLDRASGIEVIRDWRKRAIVAPILMLTGEGDELVAVEAMKAGASDYLTKGRATPELLRAKLARLGEVSRAESRQRAAEAALADKDEHLRLVARASKDVLWKLDLATGAVELSDALAAFGYGEQRVADGLAWWLERLHPEDRARCQAEFARVTTGEATTWSSEYRFRRADGSYATVVDRGYLVHDPRTGKPARVVGALMDVTRERSLEDELRQSQKLEAIGRLASGIAHDFNNLLTAILGAAEAIESSPAVSAPVAANAGIVREASLRAAALTYQLLAFGRKQVLAKRVLELGQVVHGLEGMLRRLVGEHIALVLDLEPGAGCVLADRGQLEQVIVNLVVNARDAMPSGGAVTLATRAVGAGADRLVRLVVSDTGTGMEPHVLEHVFEPFFTTKPVGRGTGLGLAAVYGIVKQSGGDVTIASAKGQGTRVEIVLPAAREERTAPTPVEAPVTAPSGCETVLVVEDDELVRVFVRDLLVQAGFTVLVADDPASAEREASEWRGEVDLLLADVVMRDGGGREAARRVLARRPRTRVLFMSGWGDDELAREGVTEAFGFIAKPFLGGALLTAVREAIDRPLPAS